MEACVSKNDQLYYDHWEFHVYVGDNKYLNTKFGQHHEMNKKTNDHFQCSFRIKLFCKKLEVLLVLRVFFLLLIKGISLAFYS